jgi:hypothetical protein
LLRPLRAQHNPSCESLRRKKPTEAAREALSGLLAKFPAATADSDARRLAERSGAAVYVTLGSEALKEMLQAGADGPVLSLLTSSEAYRDIVSPQSTEHRRVPVTALFAEASPAQQMTLVRKIFRRRITVGVLLSEYTASLEAQIRTAARAADLDLEVHRVSPPRTPSGR